MVPARLSALRAEVEAGIKSAMCDNVKRRELHAKIELLRLDLEEERARVRTLERLKIAA